MLFHLSIDADDPQHVAEVMAELWGGAALPFPPVAEGSWMAMAGDDRGTALEIYPRGCEMVEVPGDADAAGMIGSNGNRSATHFAMATSLSTDRVTAIAAREGWPIKYRNRGGLFGVLELWVEGTRMVEVLTEDMQAEYRRSMTIDGWKALLAAGPRPTPATVAA